MGDDPYLILQVARHAELEVIEAAYRRLARKYHPDVDSSPDANMRMQKINWAYEILKDPIKRASYDRKLKQQQEYQDSYMQSRHGSPPPNSASRAKGSSRTGTSNKSTNYSHEQSKSGTSQTTARRHSKAPSTYSTPKKNIGVWIAGGLIALLLLWNWLKEDNGGTATYTPTSPIPIPFEILTPEITETTLVSVPLQAVVQLVMMYEQDGKLTPVWAGSGTIISPDGLIVTNAHVALPDTYQVPSYLQISLTVRQDQPAVPTFYAEVMQVDAGMDLALIRPSTHLDGRSVDQSMLNLPYVAIGNSDKLQLGDPLTILGYPGIGGDAITLTRADVGAFTPDIQYGDRGFIKISAAIAGGNSGGLVVDSSGHLVAVPIQASLGANTQETDLVDCRTLADTNGDGIIDQDDSCVPVGGFIDALRPINLATPLIDAARRGEISVTIKPTTPTEAPEQATGILLWDDFSDTSYSNSIWSVLRGSWAVDEGVMMCNSNGKLLAGDLSWEDYVFEVEILGVDVVDKVVNFRYIETGHGYGIDFRSNPYNDVVLVKATPSNRNQILQSVHVPNYNNTWYTLAVAVKDNRIVVTIDDRIVMDYIDNDSPILHGRVGLGADLHASAISAVYFDNALVFIPEP